MGGATDLRDSDRAASDLVERVAELEKLADERLAVLAGVGAALQSLLDPEPGDTVEARLERIETLIAGAGAALRSAGEPRPSSAVFHFGARIGL